MRFKSPHDQRLDGSLRQPGGDNRDVVKTNVFNVELGNAWLVHTSAQIITGTSPCTCPTDTEFDAAIWCFSVVRCDSIKMPWQGGVNTACTPIEVELRAA